MCNVEKRYARITLWFFVIVLGLDLGAGLYETRVVVPLWANGAPATLAEGNPYAQVAINAGVHFWAYLSSAVGIAAVAALAFGLRTPPPALSWRIVAVVLELCSVAATLLYFRPTLIHLFIGHGAGLSDALIRTTIQRWVALNWIRLAVRFCAWCAALGALAIS